MVQGVDIRNQVFSPRLLTCHMTGVANIAICMTLVTICGMSRKRVLNTANTNSDPHQVDIQNCETGQHEQGGEVRRNPEKNGDWDEEDYSVHQDDEISPYYAEDEYRKRNLDLFNDALTL